MTQLLISAAHKSSGKTTITLGVCAALARSMDMRVQAFKKGPDYIDPMWLGLAAQRPCYNLDFHTMSHEEIKSFFIRHSKGADISLIEGNMGLFDSLDVEGSMSNAALAKLLNVPVVLVLDVKGATRSIVPIIQGFQQFDPELNIAGLILNKVAGDRHEKRLREVIEHYCDIPVIGAVHRDDQLAIDERHLGLIPSNEESAAETNLNQIAEIVANQVDLKALQSLASSEAVTAPQTDAKPADSPVKDVRIAYARDAAFGFYYPDDLEALQAAGAELVPFDTLHDESLPANIDGLFIGGGFPETQMAKLQANQAMRQAIEQAIEGDMPCYAECGGLMYLCRSIRWKDAEYQMVGVIPGDCQMHDKPVGRGYALVNETGDMPWPDSDPTQDFHVHEFHYSSLENLPDDLTYAYTMKRGFGIDRKRDGLIYRNLMANYVHLRSVGSQPWAQRFVQFVRNCRNEQPEAATAQPAST